MKYYFAYGSNMLERRLQAPGRVPGAKFRDCGSVSGRKLVFHKISSDGSGKCDIPFTSDPASIVYGVLYEVPDEQFAKLDAAEGVGKGYFRENVEVLRGDGTSISAVVYVAEPSATNPELSPYDWYHAFVIAGAKEHSLPSDYIARLASVATITDPDQAHAAQARKILESSSNSTVTA